MFATELMQFKVRHNLHVLEDVVDVAVIELWLLSGPIHAWSVTRVMRTLFRVIKEAGVYGTTCVTLWHVHGAQSTTRTTPPPTRSFPFHIYQAMC